jgi:hypothetical protein
MALDVIAAAVAATVATVIARLDALNRAATDTANRNPIAAPIAAWRNAFIAQHTSGTAQNDATARIGRDENSDVFIEVPSL